MRDQEHSGAAATATAVQTQLLELQADLAETTAALEAERSRLREAAASRGLEVGRLRSEAEDAREALEGLAAAHEEKLAELEADHKAELAAVRVRGWRCAWLPACRSHRRWRAAACRLKGPSAS